MALTEIEQLLIDFLRTSKASKGIQAITFIALKDEDQMLQMCRFLSDNPEAKDKEILSVAKMIGGPNCGIF